MYFNCVTVVITVIGDGNGIGTYGQFHSGGGRSPSTGGEVTVIRGSLTVYSIINGTKSSSIAGGVR